MSKSEQYRKQCGINVSHTVQRKIDTDVSQRD